MVKRKITLPLLAVFSLIVLSACGSLSFGLNADPDNPGAPKQAQAAAQATLPAAVASEYQDQLAAYQGTLENIYVNTIPSVVNIRVVEKVDTLQASLPLLPQSPFFNLPQDQAPSEQYQSGLGSGFVWDTQGHIITNNHVIANADKIEVTFSDDTIVPATLVGADPDSDLAVIQVEVPADQLKPVIMANSDTLRVGQLAIAIGDPFGLEGTMTAGIISALGRSLPVTSSDSSASYTIPDIIQTDAPINPGNSGGVLVNTEGQVIGVTAAIESPVQANAGIGFAIPSTIVNNVIPSLIKDGKYEHPWLGISGTSIVPDLAAAMNTATDLKGILVVEVLPNSPAEQAGLQGSNHTATIEGQDVPVGGDIITQINDQPVHQIDDLIAYLARNTQVGQKISLTLLRDGKEKVIEVNLTPRPTAGESDNQNTVTQGVSLGILGQDVVPEIAAAMDLPESQQGIMVVEVQADSIAERIGLRSSDQTATIQGEPVQIGGDIITQVNGQDVNSIQELRAALAGLKSDEKFTLTILRDRLELQISYRSSQ